MDPIFTIVPHPDTTDPGLRQLKLPENEKSDVPKAESTKGYPKFENQSFPKMLTLLNVISDLIEGTWTDDP